MVSLKVITGSAQLLCAVKCAINSRIKFHVMIFSNILVFISFILFLVCVLQI